MQLKTPLTRSDEYNVHSQCGEDGILARILGALGIARGTAVEFGAWDGVHLSNTALLRGQGWRTVLIESDAKKCARLSKLADERTIVIHGLVEPEGPSSLDGMLDTHDVDAVDVLSIDIDGGELEILKHLRRQPQVICVEFNPSIPPPYRFINPQGQCKGSSLESIADVAVEKGYVLVYATYCNAFFVRADVSAALEVHDAHRAFHIWPRAAVFFLYDGEFRVAGNSHTRGIRHPWTSVPVFVPRLPAMLLGWPPTRARVLVSYLFCMLAAPIFYLWQLTCETVRELHRSLQKRA